jgi:AcrR family transcriptional regulator
MARITTENKEETKANILKESLKLFTDLGYAKTNTKTIAQHCNIAEGTIFNYFKTKDDILIAAFENLSLQTELSETLFSINPSDKIIDIFIMPLRKLNQIPKQFMMDLMISAMKLSKKNNNLIYKLLALDISFVKKAEEQMKTSLTFEQNEMNAQMLSEIFYATVATDYLLYTFDESITFGEFENTIRNKLKLLMKPYHESSYFLVKED